MILLLLLAACEPAPPTSPSPPVGPPAPGEAAEHGHAATHGGIQKELDGLHLEGLITPTGAMFWVTDGDARPLAPEGFGGSVMVKGPGGVSEVGLAPMADHLHAPVALGLGQPATLVVTITQAGRAQSAQFDVAAVGLSAHDHTPLHGGQVGMWGDVHVEYLGADGTHQFWVTDAHRGVVDAPIRGVVHDGPTTIPLTLDAATARLSAAAPDAGVRPVTVDLEVGGTPLSLSFNPSR